MPDISTGTYPAAELPEIKIISPVQTENIKAGSDIIIKTQTNSSVKKVEFFLNDKSIGYDTKAPFSWVGFNTPAGNYTLKVIATNLNGKKKETSVKLLIK